MPAQSKDDYGVSFRSAKEVSEEYAGMLEAGEQYYAALNEVAKRSNLKQLKDALDAQEAAFRDKMKKLEEEFERKQEDASISQEELRKAEAEFYKKKHAAEKEFNETKQSLTEQAAQEARRVEAEAAKVAEAAWIASLQRRSSAEKVEIKKRIVEQKNQALQKAEAELDVLAVLAERGDAADKEAYQRKLAQIEDLKRAEEDARNDLRKAQLDEINELAKSRSAADRKLAKEKKTAYLAQVNDEAKAEYDSHRKRTKELSKRLGQATDSSEIASLQAELAAEKAATREAGAKMNQAAFAKIGNELSNALGDAVTRAFREAEEYVVNNQSHINAALQGSDKNFQKLTDKVTNILSLSPLVKMEDVIQNIQKASDEGIVYNLEQRAFLETVADKISHTFNAFDANLLRLIRLQQADTTAARLGMEASLRKFFNSTFQDSSYLKDVYDTVSAAILDANSQLDKNSAAEFEYVTQKWLGSLYSTGISQGAVSSIAEGINMLATGDVKGLAGNDALQTLLVMSANNAGLDYAELMLKGLDASSTNKLLQSMILYLKDIAENTDNQVVKAAYSDLFNLSVSDLKAISNLTTSDISNIAGMNKSYSSMMAETSNQLVQILARSAIPEMLNNIYSNVTYGLGMDTAANPVLWSMYKMIDFMESRNIDMNIPFVNAMGFGLDLNASVLDLMKTGLGFGQGVTLVANLFNSLRSGGGLSLDAWKGTEFNTRGSGIGGLLSTMLGGTSSSTSNYTANSSSGDVVNQTLNEATADAENTKKITNKNSQPPDRTLDDFWDATVGISATDYFMVRDVVLGNVYDSGLQALRTNDIGLIQYFTTVFGSSSLIGSGNLRVVDNDLKSELNSTSNRIVSELIAIKTALQGGSGNKGMMVTFGSTMPKVQLDKDTLKQAILTAFGSDENTAINLATFIRSSIGEGAGTGLPPKVDVANINKMSTTLPDWLKGDIAY